MLRYDAFGLIGAALSTKISVFQSSSLKVAPISPNAHGRYTTFYAGKYLNNYGSETVGGLSRVPRPYYYGPFMQPSIQLSV